MANDRRFVIRVLGDASDAMKAFDSLDKGANNMGSKFNELGKTAVRAFGAISVGAMGTAAVSAASDLEESINAVQVTFGEAAEGVLALGENSAKTPQGVSYNVVEVTRVLAAAVDDHFFDNGQPRYKP